jgi:uncharacterized protein (TIGR02117 family)
MKKSFKYLLYLILFPLLIIGLYFSIAYIFTLFPKDISNTTVKKKNIHILYSSIHTDIVFNIKDINLSKFPKFKEKKVGYLAFGWGDKETYLNTPKLGDIKLSTTLKALFLNTPSLMHVSYIPNIFRYKNIKTIKLSNTQSNHLETSIIKNFSSKRKVYKGYEGEDFFYNAKDKYNLINTCNTWTGDKLRESNISVAYWTPFVWSIINSLP